MGKFSRNKGKCGERELALKLKEHGYEAKRGQQYCGITGAADVVGLDGIHIECKRVESLRLEDAMMQSIRDSKEGELPCVMHRKNDHEWLVVMKLDDWIKMYRDYEPPAPFMEVE